MTFRYLLSGSVVAIVASLGVASGAIALPEQDMERQTLIAQDVDISETQTRVTGTVASIDAQQGFIRVNIEDSANTGVPGVDTIYMGSGDISRLDIDEGEEVTLIYENEQAIAVIRNDEIVRLNPNTPDDVTGQVTTPTQPPVIDQQPDQTQQPTMQRPEPAPQPQPTYQQQQTAPQTQQPEPVQGLW